MPFLHTLHLSSGKINDAGVSFLSALTTLQDLSISSNRQMTDVAFKSLGNLKLQSLNIAYSGITGSLFTCLNPLMLNNLILVDCRNLTTAGLASISNLTALEKLNLCLCKQVMDSDLLNLKDMKQLNSLYLRGTSITPTGLGHIKHLENLKEVTLFPMHNPNAADASDSEEEGCQGSESEGI